jgi:hypothetical protein
MEISHSARGRQTNSQENFKVQSQKDDEIQGTHSQDGRTNILFKRMEQTKHDLIRKDDDDDLY